MSESETSYSSSDSSESECEPSSDSADSLQRAAAHVQQALDYDDEAIPGLTNLVQKEAGMQNDKVDRRLPAR